jgi:ubiquitin C-terminal hydrolase
MTAGINDISDSPLDAAVTGLPAERVRCGAAGTSIVIGLPDNLDRIPSIHDNPVRFLGRIIDGSLTDRKNTEGLREKVSDGLVLIDRCSLKSSQKLWICHHLLLQQIRWALLIYEITMAVAAELEKKVSVYIRKWLGIAKCMTSVCLYSDSSPCPLPLQSITSMLKSAKVSGFQQLNYSKDPHVSSRPPPTSFHSPHRVLTKASSDAELLRMAKGIDNPGNPVTCPVSNLTISNDHCLPCLKICPVYNTFAMSGTPVILKAGENWDAGKASCDAESEVRVKKVLGVTRTTRAGLGSLIQDISRIPDSKHSKRYRKAVGTAVKEQAQRELSAKAAGEALQCQWVNWTSYIQNDLRWADILAMPPNLLSFCLNATFNTLPSPANLQRMQVQTENSCGLCNHSPCTVTHVLSGCSVALHQKRYEFRHDCVLREISVSLKDFLKDTTDQVEETSGIDFVREGADPRRSRRSGRQDGILQLSNDWKLTVDLDKQKNYSFPRHLAITRERPDILLESTSSNRVVLIELTCPCEENFAGANAFKRRKYKTLIEQIRSKGVIVDYFPIEVGARGYCAENVRSMLSRLGYSGKTSKALLKRAARSSLTASFVLWLNRATRVWNPQDSADVVPSDLPSDPCSSHACDHGSPVPPERNRQGNEKVTYSTLLGLGDKSSSVTPVLFPPPEQSSTTGPALIPDLSRVPSHHADPPGYTGDATVSAKLPVETSGSKQSKAKKSHFRSPGPSVTPVQAPPPEQCSTAGPALTPDLSGVPSHHPDPPGYTGDVTVSVKHPVKASVVRKSKAKKPHTRSLGPSVTQVQFPPMEHSSTAGAAPIPDLSGVPSHHPDLPSGKVSGAAKHHVETSRVKRSKAKKPHVSSPGPSVTPQHSARSHPNAAVKSNNPPTKVTRFHIPTGIVNKGNTCYAGVILQSLSLFSEYFSVCPESPGLLKAFVSTMRLLSESRNAPVDPLIFLTHLQSEMRTSQGIRDFVWNMQQDVPHILSVLMERIKTESVSASQLSEIPVRTVTTCSVCNYKSVKLNPQQFLVVPVRSSLSAMVADFSSEQVVEGDNGYQCPQCSMKQKAFQRDELASAPLMMVLVLRRYEKSISRGSLHPSFVRSTQRFNHRLPLEVCIRSDSGKEMTEMYESVSVIHHIGSLGGGGHYFAHVKKTQTWFKCNDQQVYASKPKDIGQSTASVVFCRRVST